jgi:AraC-like DNA-binding protein
VKSEELPRFCGIDGLPGEGGGIQLVRDSILDASYIYPTHGDRLIDLAMAILEGKPYDKELQLRSAIVTRDNANVLLMQGEEMMRQSQRLDQLHRKANSYLQQLDAQRTVTLLAFGTIALLIVAIVLFYRYHIGQIALRRERVVNTLWALNPEDVTPHPVQEAPTEVNAPSAQQPETTVQQERTHSADSGEPLTHHSESENLEKPSAAVAKPSAAVAEHPQLQPEPQPRKADSEPEPTASTSFFITRFKEAVEARLDDSELSVEDLASDMHLSRVQLYRKVKAVTGSTPVELLRTARLKRGYQLLLTTDKSVSEVAYLVGFTAPSYFTKCFKEEYGQLPGDVRSS